MFFCLIVLFLGLLFTPMASPYRLALVDVNIAILITNYSLMYDDTQIAWVDAVFEMAQIWYALNSQKALEVVDYVKKYNPRHLRGPSSSFRRFNSFNLLNWNNNNNKN